MRNIHLWLGLMAVGMALIFALSSLVFVYRQQLDMAPEETEMAVKLSGEALASPRAAGRELMAAHGLKGELRQIEEKDGKVSFRILSPAQVTVVEYDPASGEGTAKLSRLPAFETLLRLHTNHGLWHDYFPANAWAALSLATSLGLLLLGVSGLYLWFSFHKERVIGSVLLGVGLAFSLVVIVLTRLEQ